MILGSNFVNLYYLLKSGRNGPNYATVADAQNDGAITIKYLHSTHKPWHKLVLIQLTLLCDDVYQSYGRFLQILVSFLVVVVMLFVLVRIMQEVHNHVSWRRVRSSKLATVLLISQMCSVRRNGRSVHSAAHESVRVLFVVPFALHTSRLLHRKRPRLADFH